MSSALLTRVLTALWHSQADAHAQEDRKRKQEAQRAQVPLPQVYAFGRIMLSDTVPDPA